MKKKIFIILEKNIVNISTLVILLILIVFISNSINNYTTYKLIETSFDLPKDYNSFMTNFYQTQSNWLMFWLTLLTCLTAIIGIAIPFVLNQSYREKIKEMENEFQKQLKDLDNYKKQSAENLKTLKSEVKQIKNQELQSKQALPKMFSKEILKFKNGMQNAIDEVKQENILFEIEKLYDSSSNYRFANNEEEEFNCLNKLINIAEKYKKIYKKSELFKQSLNFYLEQSYYSRALIYQYRKNEYLCAISDYNKSKNIKLSRCEEKNDETIDTCLLYCYAQLHKYNECDDILNSLDKFPGRRVKETLKVLEKSNESNAKELVIRIKSKIEEPN